jgi:hypothetical protein
MTDRVAYARIGRNPGDRLMGLLERQMETISGEFDSEDVSRTLWAYARIGRKQGERLMVLLEGRMETISGEFSSQNVSDTLWAYDGDEAGGTPDGSAAGSGGCDIRGCQLAGCF